MYNAIFIIALRKSLKARCHLKIILIVLEDIHRTDGYRSDHETADHDRRGEEQAVVSALVEVAPREALGELGRSAMRFLAGCAPGVQIAFDAMHAVDALAFARVVGIQDLNGIGGEVRNEQGGAESTDHTERLEHLGSLLHIEQRLVHDLLLLTFVDLCNHLGIRFSI